MSPLLKCQKLQPCEWPLETAKRGQSPWTPVFKMVSFRQLRLFFFTSTYLFILETTWFNCVCKCIKIKTLAALALSPRLHIPESIHIWTFFTV